ncbi:MAG TPA: hypothetical protein VFN29_08395 [Chiayiivirga sp.]|nr:hypothetical protein [Chiayiivirga sp.]
MHYKLISLLPLQLARVVGLVRAIEIVELDDRSQPGWVLLARGRGFTRILRDDPLPLPGVMRPLGWNMPRPLRFHSLAIARNYGECMGLLPRQKKWPVKTAPEETP